MFASNSSRFLAAALLVPALVLPSLAQATQHPVPRIHFLYPAPDGTIFDRICGEWLKRERNPALVAEALRRKPELEAQWAQTGTRYLRIALDGAKNPFPYGEMQANLSVCSPDSIAFPLIINVEEILSPDADKYPHDFPLLVFHEIMHHYGYAIEARSPVLKKYAHLPLSVRAHVHVVAFERLVLLQTGQQQRHDQLREYYHRKENTNYSRAWAVVDAEGIEAVVNDARNTL